MRRWRSRQSSASGPLGSTPRHSAMKSRRQDNTSAWRGCRGGMSSMSSCQGGRPGRTASIGPRGERSNPGRPSGGAPPRSAISVFRQFGETCMARCSRHRRACGELPGTPGQTAMKSPAQAWTNAGCCAGFNPAPPNPGGGPPGTRAPICGGGAAGGRGLVAITAFRHTGDSLATLLCRHGKACGLLAGIPRHSAMKSPAQAWTSPWADAGPIDIARQSPPNTSRKPEARPRGNDISVAPR